MSRTVFANQSGAVETQNNWKILNRYVVDDIIMRPLHKRRIDIAERLQSVFAIPPEKVTACPSAMPTSKARFGIFSISIFIEQPLGMAGVTPTIFGLASASSTSVFPNTSWKSGAFLRCWQ